jgi:hypothetical protein
VYHDFTWTELFSDQRTQFKNGLSLAHLVCDGCPAGKRPALLLTIDENAVERALETEDEYVVVVRIRQYLAEAEGDAAAAYYAHHLRTRITQLAVLEELGQSPDRLVSFLEDHLTVDLVETWMTASPDRLDVLRRVASPGDSSPRLSPERVAEALRAMGEVPQAVWEALVEVLPPLLDEETRQRLLNVITADPRGREAASAMLGARVADRISDTRKAISEYEELLRSETASETALQSFIEDHPWMVGLDYVSVRARRLLPRGQLDFCLERFDGFYDILELKGPNDPIVLASSSSDDLPPPASSFRLGPALANALAQVHVYRDSLALDSGLIGRLYGLKNSRDPRLIIVIGKASAMTEDCQRVLEQLNLSLHRVEVMPYDVLGARAEGWLSNIEHYLGVETGA